MLACAFGTVCLLGCCSAASGDRDEDEDGPSGGTGLAGLGPVKTRKDFMAVFDREDTDIRSEYEEMFRRQQVGWGWRHVCAVGCCMAALIAPPESRLDRVGV